METNSWSCEEGEDAKDMAPVTGEGGSGWGQLSEGRPISLMLKENTLAFGQCGAGLKDWPLRSTSQRNSRGSRLQKREGLSGMRLKEEIFKEPQVPI